MARTTVERNISYDTQRKVYYVCMDAGRNSSGQRSRCYRTAATLREARKLLRSFYEQKNRGSILRPTAQTLAEWLDYWLEEIILPTRAATTAYGYRKIIDNHIVPALGHIPLQRVTAGEIQRYYTTLLREKDLSPNTIRKHHDLLAAALHAAVRQDLLPYCPADRVDPPRLQPVETSFYGPGDLRRLFDLIRDTPLDIPVRLAGSLGLRREEVCGLKWSRVDLDRRLIHICLVRTCAGGRIVEKEPKNGTSVRTLHIPNEIYLLLKREKRKQEARRRELGDRWQDTDFVVVDAFGTPPSPNALTYAFTCFIKQHSLPHLTLHGLRHSFATVASQQGVPLFEIGKALGHSTPSTTGRIYTHLIDCTHSAALDRVAEAVR